uniref:Signal recognition particle 19 kDa protein n=1 Tax=Thermofilum pendens TaxID=2269 RepID=A0A7C1T169_THEPE
MDFLRRKDGYVIWPAYFDATHPRSKGRKVPLRLAVEKPSLGELVEAARAAGVRPSGSRGAGEVPRLLVRATWEDCRKSRREEVRGCEEDRQGSCRAEENQES